MVFCLMISSLPSDPCERCSSGDSNEQPRRSAHKRQTHDSKQAQGMCRVVHNFYHSEVEFWILIGRRVFSETCKQHLGGVMRPVSVITLRLIAFLQVFYFPLIPL